MDSIGAITNDVRFIYSPPPNVNKKVILLTTGKVAIIGPWKDGVGVIAWHPLPKRDKQFEKDKGI